MKVNIKKIDAELERLQWSRARLALESRITRQALYRIIDKQIASIATLNKIGEALNLTPKDLLT